jgi:hypothetical protein
MQELHPLSTTYGPITYGDLAKLMAMFPEVEDIQRGFDVVPSRVSGFAVRDQNDCMSTRQTSMTGALLAAVALSVSACVGSSSLVPTAIDGFTLGASESCHPPADVDAAALDRSCAGYPKRATAALDAREPGHPAVVSVAMYADGTQPASIDVTGDAAPPTPRPRHPGPSVTVFVFTLADGFTRATGVACDESSPPSCVGVGSYPGG